MAEPNSLPNFPTLPVVVDVKRRKFSPDALFYALLRALLAATALLERFRFPRRRAKPCSTREIVPAALPATSCPDVERWLSPLDDRQFEQLRRASGEDEVVAVWDALLNAPRDQASRTPRLGK